MTKLKETVDRLIGLVLRPERFFESELKQFEPTTVFGTEIGPGATAEVLFLTWACGVANVIDNVGLRLLMSQMGRGEGSPLASSWFHFWPAVLIGGAVSGLIYWYIGGWWYRIRAHWSGDPEPNPIQARVIMIWSTAILAVASIIWAMVQTALFDNYQAAALSNRYIPRFIFILPFWTVVVSYRGAMTAFELEKWKAIVWFLVVPGVFYLAIYMGGASLMLWK